MAMSRRVCLLEPFSCSNPTRFASTLRQTIWFNPPAVPFRPTEVARQSVRHCG
jgi:hypothetical protein